MVSILFISTANCRRKEFQFELEVSLIVLGFMDPCVYGIRWYTMIRSVGTGIGACARSVRYGCLLAAAD